jgi:glycosyltransferase involved in cell wall biosynthesis
VSTLAQRLAQADVVVASHVYLARLIAWHWQGELWYDAHNVEADMKADILGVDRLAAPFSAAAGESFARGAEVTTAAAAVAAVAAAERALVRSARRVFAVSANDAARFAALYGRDLASIEEVPNGVTLPEDPWLEPERRAGLKASLGFAERPVALFVGADHGPNQGAADVVVDAARRLPQWSFWVAGSICNYEGLRHAPAHVYRLGVVSEAELTTVLRATDLGLNPMLQGSGTNLKMLDYAAHGALVLSTEVGARGLGFVGDTHYVTFAPDGLAPALQGLEAELPSPRLAMRAAARARVGQHFSWRGIADRIELPERPR